MSFTLCEQIVTSMARAVVGKRESLELLMVGLLAEGHVLIEDVPGLGKTLIAKALAQSIAGIFKRVQFTPDLLPSDVTGYSVYNQQAAEFQFQPGPVVTNVLLADEINRTIPRTQASLLESMEERQVTVDGRTLKLPTPFFVIATQNPIELEGTFPLPEAHFLKLTAAAFQYHMLTQCVLAGSSSSDGRVSQLRANVDLGHQRAVEETALPQASAPAAAVVRSLLAARG